MVTMEKLKIPNFFENLQFLNLFNLGLEMIHAKRNLSEYISWQKQIWVNQNVYSNNNNNNNLMFLFKEPSKY